MYLAKIILKPNFGEPNKAEPFKWNSASPIGARAGALLRCVSELSEQSFYVVIVSPPNYAESFLILAL